MTNEELNTKLYEKLFAEQEEFKTWLLNQPPQEILKYAYAYSVRENILTTLMYHTLSAEQAWALLESEKPLDDIFHIFESVASDYTDIVYGCIECQADKKIEIQREEQELTANKKTS